MSDEITKAEREELRALHAKTTQGEWHYDDGVTDGEGTADAERGKDPWVIAANGTLVAAIEGVEDPDPATVPALDEMDANGKFIARAHGIVPRLLRALDAAEEDLAASETAINALDCHYGASEELGHDCHDATPCMREKLEAQRDAAGDERDALKAKLDAAEAKLNGAATLIRIVVAERDAAEAEAKRAKSELDGVMHSVDKWFDDDDPRLTEDNPATRASTAREIALQWGEKAEAEFNVADHDLAILRQEHGKVVAESDALKAKLDALEEAAERANEHICPVHDDYDNSTCASLYRGGQCDCDARGAFEAKTALAVAAASAKAPPPVASDDDGS